MPRIIEVGSPPPVGITGNLTVVLTPDSGPSVTLIPNSDGPMLTDGFGGWEVIDRPKRSGLTRFKGTEPFRQSISFLFDGWQDSTSQEPLINNLIKMARPVGALGEPPKVSLSGHALRKNLLWVIEGIDWETNSTIWDIKEEISVRIRQAGVVRLLEYIDDNVIVTASTPAAQNKSQTKRVVVSGLTLKQLAQLVYGDPNAYQIIYLANRWLNPDPRAIIPNGTPVSIPQYKGHHARTVVVGQGSKVG